MSIPLSFYVDTTGLNEAQKAQDAVAESANKMADAVDKADAALEKTAKRRRTQYDQVVQGLDDVAKVTEKVTKATEDHTKADDRYYEQVARRSSQTADAIRQRTEQVRVEMAAAQAMAAFGQQLARTGQQQMEISGAAAAALGNYARSLYRAGEEQDRLGSTTERLALGFGRLFSGASRLAAVFGVQSDAAQAFEGVTRSFTRMDAAGNLLGGSLGRIAAIGAGVGAVVVAAAAAVKHVNDEYEQHERRLSSLYGSQVLAARAFADIRQQALDTGEAVKTAAEQYEKFQRATNGLGATTTQTRSISSTVSMLARLGGATPQEQAGASSTLSAMLREGKVEARELEAIFNNMPGLARTLADGLGVSVLQLRLMVDAGKVTNRDVFDALLSQQHKVNKEFETMGLTLGGMFNNILTGVSDMVVGLYRASAAIEIVSSKADAARRKQEANPNRPTRATPRVINNPGQSVVDIETQLGLNPYSEGPGTDGIMADLQDRHRALMSRAAAEIEAGSKIASQLDPMQRELSQTQKMIETVNTAIAALQSGLTDLTADQATAQIARLTRALESLQQKSLESNTAYGKALEEQARRQQQTELGMTAGQRAADDRARGFMSSQPGLSYDAARGLAEREQKDAIDELIRAQMRELEMQTAMTAAMRHGKVAADDAAVAMQILGISVDKLGNLDEEALRKLELLAEIMGRIREQARAQSGVNAAKPLIDELNAIAAAQAKVAEGSYAMARAQAQAKADAATDGTGDLQMKVFEARQKLSDSQTIDNLRVEIALERQLAAAIGDVAAQRRIQLDAEIERANRAAAPGSRAEIESAMRERDAQRQSRNLAEGTNEMERQLQLIKEETALVAAGSAQYAAQLAMLQKKQELLKAGVDVENDGNAKRQIELAGQIASAQETRQRVQQSAEMTKGIWQNAFDSVQRTGSDVFYNIFSGAGLQGMSVAQTLKNIFIRAFADIAAAAVIRPIIGSVIGLGQSAGILPSGITGYGGGIGGIGGLSGIGAGGAMGGGSMSSGGLGLGGFGGFGSLGSSLSGSLGSFGQWLNTPFTGVYAGISPAAMEGVPMLSGAAGAGLTPLNTIGGLASIGMGAYSLFSGGGSTGSTIGGISGIIGGGLSLAASAGLIGSAFGPIGMGIGLIGGLLGGLLGGGSPSIPPQPGLNLGIGSFLPDANGSFTSSGYGLNGGGSLGSEAGNLGSVVSTLFRSAGVKGVPGKMIGGRIWSGVDHPWNGNGWGNRPYTQAALVNPGADDGGGEYITYNDSSRNLQQVSDMLVAAVFRANVLRGGVSGASENLVKSLQNVNPQSLSEVQKQITDIKAFDEALQGFNRTVSASEVAVKKIDEAFDNLEGTAAKYGLNASMLPGERERQLSKVATDFSESLQRQLDDLSDPAKGVLSDLDKVKKAVMDENEWIVKNITGAQNQILKIEELFAAKRAAVVEQSLQQQLGSIKELIARLTLGDLSNASPTTLLSVTEATYKATLAQAQTGSKTAIGSLAGDAGNYVTALQNYYGSSVDYFSRADTVRQALQMIVEGVTGGIQSSGGTVNMVTSGQSQQIDILVSALKTANDNQDKLMARIEQLLAAQQRNY